MATTRIKDISSTVTSLASDDYLAVDGATNGTRKMVRGSIYTDVAAAFTGAPTTYDICPLNSGTGKIDATYLPTSGDTPKGEWNANTNSPALADGSGTAGDYYDVTNAGTQNLGSGNITFTVGDVVKYDGATWYKIDSVANFLDGYSTAATSRAALEVNSVDEDAEATGTKLVGPALYFDGTNDVVTVAHDSKLNFTDGSNDLPFTVSAWINASDCTNFQIVNKDDTGSNRDWSFDITSGDDLRFIVLTDGSNYEGKITSTALTTYEGQWIHVAATFGGAGPDYASGFSAAEDAVTLYINGAAVAMATGSAGTHTGMPGGTASVLVGKRGSGLFAKGHIRDVKIHNRELTADEVAQLARGNDLGYSDQYGGALGGVKTYDFSAGLDGLTAFQGTAVGNIDTIDGKDDNLRFTVSTAATAHGLYKNAIFTPGKRYRVTAEIYVHSTNSEMDGLVISTAANSSSARIAAGISVTPNTWVTITGEAIAVSDYLYIYGMDGESSTFTDAGGNDQFYIHSLKITEIGKLADFRSERFDSSTGKWYDLSDNAFVGTNTGATLVGREVPVYETGSWTPSITFGGGSTGITYVQQSGLYNRIGDTCFVSGLVQLSSKGTDTGGFNITGLPFTCRSGSPGSYIFNTHVINGAAFTSQPIFLVTSADTTAALSDMSATGQVSATDANATDTMILRFSGTYKIQ